MKYFNVGPTTVQWLATGYFLNTRYFNTSNRYFDAKIHNKTNVSDFYHTNSYRYDFSSIMHLHLVYFLAGRIIQAAGLAISLPLTQNVIFTIFPPNKRGAAMGLMGLSYVSWSSIRSNN